MFAVPKWRHWAENKLRKPMAQIGEAVFINVTISLFAVGGVAALVSGIKDFGNVNQLFVDVRRAFGRPIILGLEILVAADIIQTITVDPSIESVSVLGILVLVRIALSVSLDIEVDGMLPWAAGPDRGRTQRPRRRLRRIGHEMNQQREHNQKENNHG